MLSSWASTQFRRYVDQFRGLCLWPSWRASPGSEQTIQSDCDTRRLSPCSPCETKICSLSSFITYLVTHHGASDFHDQFPTAPCRLAPSSTVFIDDKTHFAIECAHIPTKCAPFTSGGIVRPRPRWTETRRSMPSQSWLEETTAPASIMTWGVEESGVRFTFLRRHGTALLHFRS